MDSDCLTNLGSTPVNDVLITDKRISLGNDFLYEASLLYPLLAGDLFQAASSLKFSNTENVATFHKILN